MSKQTIQQTIMARDGSLIDVTLTRKKAILAFCTICMGDAHPKHCTSPHCPLFTFRGKINLAIGGGASDEEDGDSED